MNNELIIPPFDVKMLEQRMRPGFLSQGGFLGYHESLISVLSEDDTALEQLNLTYGQVSNRLESLLKLAIIVSLSFLYN